MVVFYGSSYFGANMRLSLKRKVRETPAVFQARGYCWSRCPLVRGKFLRRAQIFVVLGHTYLVSVLPPLGGLLALSPRPRALTPARRKGDNSPPLVTTVSATTIPQQVYLYWMFAEQIDHRTKSINFQRYRIQRLEQRLLVMSCSNWSYQSALGNNNISYAQRDWGRSR